MTAESLRLQAESALASSEVEMLTEGEAPEPGAPRDPALDRVRNGGGVSGALAYALSVRVLQSVQMTRDSQITLAEGVRLQST